MLLFRKFKYINQVKLSSNKIMFNNIHELLHYNIYEDTTEVP